MLNELPPDQSAMVLYRLGEERVAEIEKEAKGVSSFYNLCIRAMGMKESDKRATKVPTKGQAYVEVLHHKLEDEMPQFSHPYIEKTVMQFGGWQEMLYALKTAKDLETARYKFYYAYDDVLDGASP